MDIEILRTYCLSLPAVTEEIKWGNDLCFSVGDKMFCVAGLDVPVKMAFKVKDEEFESLTTTEGIIPAPYLARAKWIQVNDLTLFKPREWEHYIKQAYELVKAKLTRKRRNELGIA